MYVCIQVIDMKRVVVKRCELQNDDIRWQHVKAANCINDVVMCYVLGSGQSVCMTRQCVTAASTLLQALDDSVDPCDDFYQYACGGWLKANPIPQGESRWDTFGVLRRKNQLVIKNLLGTSHRDIIYITLLSRRTSSVQSQINGIHKSQSVVVVLYLSFLIL